MFSRGNNSDDTWLEDSFGGTWLPATACTACHHPDRRWVERGAPRASRPQHLQQAGGRPAQSTAFVCRTRQHLAHYNMPCSRPSCHQQQHRPRHKAATVTAQIAIRCAHSLSLLETMLETTWTLGELGGERLDGGPSGRLCRSAGQRRVQCNAECGQQAGALQLPPHDCQDLQVLQRKLTTCGLQTLLAGGATADQPQHGRSQRLLQPAAR